MTQNTIRNISHLQTNFLFTANMAWSKEGRLQDKQDRLLTDLMGICWRLTSDDNLYGPRSSTYCLVGRNLRFALGDFEHLHLDSFCRHHDELDCMFYNAICYSYSYRLLPISALFSRGCLQATVSETLASMILLIQIARVCSHWIVLSTARVSRVVALPIISSLLRMLFYSLE